MSKVIRSVVSIGATLIGAAIGTLLFGPIGGAVGAALFSAGAGLLLGKPGGPRRASAAQQLQLGEQPRQAIIGRAAVGGSLVDAFNYGGKYNTDWEVLVIALADHRCDALEGFFVDDTYVAFAGDGTVAGYNNQLQVFWRSGTWDQAVPSILTTNGPGWTANDRGRGVAYVVVAYKADAQDAKSPVWPNGRPRFRWVVRGLRCYDPRLDSTVGGSGAHRRDNAATWTWSENPIVVRHNWVCGIYAGDRVTEPGMLLIGRGLSAIEAPPANVFARANLCDELIGGAPRYRVGGVVASTEPFIDVESDFAAACAGTISQPEGAVEIDPGQAKAPVAHFTDGDLLVGSKVTWSSFLGQQDEGWVNTVTARFVDPAQRWNIRSAPVRRDLADVIADGGPRETQPQLDLVTNVSQAQRIAEIIRRFGRLWGRAQVTLPPRFCYIEEGDWVTWQSDRRFDGATRTFRVEAWASNRAWHHQLILRQISASVYSDTAPLDDGVIASTQPPPPVVAAPDIDAWDVTPITVDSSGERVPILLVSGAVDDPAAQFVVFEYAQQATPPDAQTVWTFAANSRPDISRVELTLGTGGVFYVGVSYIVDGILGDRLVLGPVILPGLLEDVVFPGIDAANAAATAAQSDASAANAAAASANAAITTILADGILSRDEKPEIRKQRAAIISEYPIIRARGVALNVTVATFDTGYTDLTGYLATLDLDSATDTVIDRAYFNARFVDYFAARQSVLDGVADEASKRAALAPANANRVPFSRFEGGRGWGVLGGTMTVSVATRAIAAGGLVFIRTDAAPTGAGQTLFAGQTGFIPVRAGERLSVSAQVEVYAPAGAAPDGWILYIEYLDDANIVGELDVAGGNGNAYSDTRRAAFSTVPAGATRARIVLYIISGGGGDIVASIVAPMVASAAAGQTVHPDYSPGPNADDGADITSANTAAFVAGQGDLATRNAATLPFGSNSVVNSDFTRGKFGWFWGAGGFEGDWGVNLTGPPEYFGQRNVMFAGVPGTFAINSTRDLAPNAIWNGAGMANAPLFAMPVVAGDRLVASVLAAQHRCTFQLYTLIFDGAGTLISAPVTGGGTTGGAANGDPANFTQLTVFGDVPAGGRWAIPMMRLLGTGEDDPYIFFAEPLLAKVAAGQSVPPRYVPGRADPNADVTAEEQRSIAGPAIAALNYASTGALDPSEQLPVDLIYILKNQSGPISSGVTWQYRIIEGAVNGFAAGNTLRAMSVSAGAGTLTLSNLGSNNAQVEIIATFGNGLTNSAFLMLSKAFAAPSADGSGGSTIASQTSGFTSVTSSTFTSVSNEIEVTSATTTQTVAVQLQFRPPNNTESSSTMEVQVERWNGSAWVSMGAAVTADSQVFFDSELNRFIRYYAGFSFERTEAITAGTSQRARIRARLAAGVVAHSVYGTLTLSA
ncbi:MAG: phage tail protein [Erythrobacter sp.]|jgi:hypothetical protein